MIAVVPARKGSKSIPGKNHRVIAGRPLVAWVIDAALGAERVDTVVVTTDDEEVARIARGLGADVHDRSAASATDTAPTEAVLAEVLAAYPQHDEYVLLQATSPLTTAADIDGAIALHRDGGYDSVLSVSPQHRFVWQLRENGEATPWNYDPRARPRRQDAEPVHVENGAVYVSTRRLLDTERSRLGGRMGAYAMAPETYFELDEPEDWTVIERFLLERKQQAAGWAEIALVLTDVDGVLTDNGMYWSSDGSELKRFSARDGKGFELLHRAGVKTALITSESRELVARRGEKLGVHHTELACRDKVAAAERLRTELGLTWEQIAFVGDDVHDLELLQRVGASFAPADGMAVVRAAVDHVLAERGGAGAFREAADLLLSAR